MERLVTELDLGLKCGVRRLLWNIGYSTRLDVVLRGTKPTAATSSRSASAEPFTDLDVLGVLASNESHISTVIADCKTGRHDRPTARIFWLKGVSAFFCADRAMLVREHEVNDAARQLAAKLRITVLASGDLRGMQALHSCADQPDPVDPLEVLFDRVAVAQHLKAFSGLDKRLDDLVEYRHFDYWIYEQHRNLTQMVAHLGDARKILNPKDPTHVALVLDMAWQYILTIVAAVEHIRGAFLGDPDRGLKEYMFGGIIELREKEGMAEALRELAPDGSTQIGVLPAYYSGMRELVARFLRRPTEIQDALRHVELACGLAVARKHLTLAGALGPAYNRVAAKLAADVVGFLISAADLNGAFRSEARAYLLAEPVESNDGSRASVDLDPAVRAGVPLVQPALELGEDRPAVTEPPRTEAEVTARGLGTPGEPERDDHIQ